MIIEEIHEMQRILAEKYMASHPTVKQNLGGRTLQAPNRGNMEQKITPSYPLSPRNNWSTYISSSQPKCQLIQYHLYPKMVFLFTMLFLVPKEILKPHMD